MKASNFRIGNKFDYDGEVCTVFEIDDDNLDEHPRVNYLGCNSAKGIPLTEEWLIKYGFKKVGTNYENGWLLLHTHNKTGNIDFLLNEPISGKLHVTTLQYVHQLQNLYFALTGKELTIKNK